MSDDKAKKLFRIYLGTTFALVSCFVGGFAWLSLPEEFDFFVHLAAATLSGAIGALVGVLIGEHSKSIKTREVYRERALKHSRTSITVLSSPILWVGIVFVVGFSLIYYVV